MPRDFAPHPYQKIAAEFLMENDRCALWAGMGMGKTSTVLTTLDMLAAAGEGVYPALVLAPKRVARDTWPDEQKKWTHLSGLKIAAIVGTENQRLAAMRSGADIFTTNYEQLPWLIDLVGDRWPFRTVIADESTRLKSFRITQGGKRARAISKVAHLAKRWINLTGTPAPNGLIDLWGQTWFLDYGSRLGKTFSDFRDRWFQRGYDGFSQKAMPHSNAEIHSRLRDVCLTLDAKDWFDLEDPIVRPLRVRLPPAVMKKYHELETTMFTQLMCGTEIEAFNAMALTGKCLQMANGAVYTDDKGTWTESHSVKLEALESVLAESGGMPLLVAYEFVSDRQRILKHFGNKVAELDKTPGMKRFRAGDAAIGLAHPASMGHGIDGLQDVTNILVRFGHNWNLEQRLQMLERIGPVRQKQSGHQRPVFVYDIIAEKTIDEDIIERHEAKRDVQDILLAAMKRSIK